jgi:hypothetical protein
LPNALRWATWCAASDSAILTSDAEPSTQSSRVIDTISMIVATPRPSAPSRHPTAFSYSTSADALDRLPSLSLRRTSRMPLRLPSGSTRGTTKQVSPSGAWARVRNRSFIGAEVNHLWPVSR